MEKAFDNKKWYRIRDSIKDEKFNDAGTCVFSRGGHEFKVSQLLGDRLLLEHVGGPARLVFFDYRLARYSRVWIDAIYSLMFPGPV